ncbi:hypothetical protein BRADI_1g41640v3 [Brachypodium distachyon]|uniref:tRNA-uridine aminocarboxypropyltransferase n=1 Tax=Brachypodium distachyon TaxID=15368 RepID=A0A2K2DNP7_BRADI|nr:hypothetical protein BRADI_1g41640v3 [Brachypodium distachyon]PNT75907.1 hypothetical protein BRADI_1g41640v3 [Brachypodium distachyon]
MLARPTSIRSLAFHRRLPLPHPPALLRRPQGPPPCPTPTRSLMVFSAEIAVEEAEEEALSTGAGDGGEVSTEEWQRWGTSSPLPNVVSAVVRELLRMESLAGEKMRFGGVGSKLKGDFKDVEDKKHRAVYETLPDSDQKLQYYSARQIGCRLLGSRGYLCQKCWLPMEDCMCSKLAPCNLWRGIKFWLYMHPKDFLRQNNTGKLLWQVFGIQAAPLCLFGIQEQEDIMWDAFQRSGKGKVSFLYPNKSTTPKSVQDLKFDDLTLNAECQEMEAQGEPLNLVLLDGTWSNSAALYRRLKVRFSAFLIQHAALLLLVCVCFHMKNHCSRF